MLDVEIKRAELRESSATHPQPGDSPDQFSG